ncbi:MAG: hypothetical protein BGO99_04875 [Nitrosospira sp. 56-18]|nr:hypothetical protein [Nitrosospira sp.]OJY14711.1 MAG: hypothetical protein BGO99_04875 [Nitrosospira sp. 56-18]
MPRQAVEPTGGDTGQRLCLPKEYAASRQAAGGPTVAWGFAFPPLPGSVLCGSFRAALGAQPVFVGDAPAEVYPEAPYLHSYRF